MAVGSESGEGWRGCEVHIHSHPARSSETVQLSGCFREVKEPQRSPLAEVAMSGRDVHGRLCIIEWMKPSLRASATTLDPLDSKLAVFECTVTRK